MMKKMVTLALFAGLTLSGAASGQDLAKGKRAYNKCKACHTLTDSGSKRAGPHLENIFGREAASIEGFKYSNALKNSGLTWDEETLAAWITSPRKFLPGNRMTFIGIRREAELKDLLAYLKESTTVE